MLQKDLLLPWRTALGNVMLGLEITRCRRAPRRRIGRARCWTSSGLHGFADHYPVDAVRAACASAWRWPARW